MPNRVKVYDTTLRDGAQSERISFSVEDKLRIAKRLDEFGVHYIEGGWPGSNPKDMRFFEESKDIKWKNARIVAFGSTRHAKSKTEEDANLKALLDAGIETVCVVGKSWELHVKGVLRIPLKENLKLIGDSVSFLKEQGKEVIYDAEHFFDGFKDDSEYALSTLKVAQEAGADCLVLCDTNGGTMPHENVQIIEAVMDELDAPLGIHSHNDTGNAVANTVEAVRLGIGHIQGTINGYGERCGNTNLCTVVPNIQLKLGVQCVPKENLRHLTELSRFVSEISNLTHYAKMPYVGESAFAHKGGIHVHAVSKDPRTYEHTNPVEVGNLRRVLISELAGRTNVSRLASEFGVKLKKETPETREILKTLKELESEGYQFEGAEASFELLVKKATGMYKSFFDIEGFRVFVGPKNGGLVSEATVMVRVDGRREHTAAEGDGPVNALDNALRKALEKFYPDLKEMQLTDYKVRVLNEREGTGARVRVLIQSSDEKDVWGTVGVSENIIEASLEALLDSFDYKLLRDRGRKN